MAGFAAGVYFLPILIAPPAPSSPDVAAAASGATYKGEFRRNLKDSDALHWGEEFVETEADFARVKPRMVRVGEVKVFDNFIVPLPESVDIEGFNTVIVWCETFGQFITAARYK